MSALTRSNSILRKFTFEFSLRFSQPTMPVGLSVHQNNLFEIAVKKDKTDTSTWQSMNYLEKVTPVEENVKQNKKGLK